ncbi:hypothetical protein [Ramlibacter sp.]|uniref:hypothetical protein n=1 Tax=Ramlibacter sp. TaxID=1917967 RepID=UPI00261B352D|nr:hypothetical protein [Ramlibacter sp.]MDB5956564.1 hypothetical protein [Ramlibacter sp.]
MKNLLTPSRTLAVPLLVAYCTCAVAQSLGAPAADVWIGQPLDMSVPARFASNEADDQCVHADVFYGDKQQLRGVRATVIGTEANRRVRIETDTAIDEPVVTVSLRAGCRNFVTRSYTLLPDIPSETVLAALMRPQAPPLLTAATTLAPQRSPLVRAPRRPSVSPANPGTTVADTTTADAAPLAAPRIGRALRRAVPGQGARLRLEPLTPDPQAFLRVTATLADPQGDAARRATAALMWQAINADPQDLLRTSAMLQKLESEMAQLRRSAAQTHSDMADLRRRFEEPQPWYASPAAIQVLSLLVLAAAAAAGLLWFRTRHLDLTRGPWYATAAEPFEPVHAPVAATEVQAAPFAVRPLRAEPVPASAVREARPVPPVVPLAVPQVAVVSAAPSGPGPIDFTLPATPRRPASGVLRVETLGATFQEVEFLSSLGLATDAMEVLKTYLHDSSSPAPLAYFELMRLCDQDEDPAAVTAVRRRYAQVFRVEAPSLQQVTAGRGLESMADLSERISRTWESAEVLDLIEDTLFNVPAPGAALTLQAGRDLICLHELALALVTEGATQADAESQPLAPWAYSDDPAAAQAATQALADADGGHHFALDVDLNAAPEPLPQQQEPEAPPEPEVDLELAPLLAELHAAAERNATARAQAEAEDAFSAAVALERAPASRY